MAPPLLSTLSPLLSTASTYNETILARISQYLLGGGVREVHSTIPLPHATTMAVIPATSMAEENPFDLARGDDASARSPVKPVKQTIADCLLTVISAAGAVADAAQCRNVSDMFGSVVEREDKLQPRNEIGMQPYRQAEDLPLALYDGGNSSLQRCCQGEVKMSGDAQNCHLIKMLCKHGYAIVEDDPRVASSMTIKAIVAMLQKKPKAEQLVARNILRDLGYYGGHKTEPISSDYQAKVVTDLIAREIFGGNVEAFIVAQLNAAKKSSPLTITDLIDVLRKRIYDRLLITDTEDQPVTENLRIKQWIWQHVVLDALPVLRHERDNQGNAFDLRRPEWGQIHAGLAFAKAVGIDLETVSQAQALAMGKMLQAELHEKIILSQWDRFFWLPAQCHASLTHPQHAGDGEQNRQDVVAAYFAFVDQFVDAQCPLMVFQKALSSFQTRPQLARQIVDKKCPSIKVSSLLNRGSSICWQLPFPHVENVNEAYWQEVLTVADAYAHIDELLLMSAWSQLAEEEIDFIDAAEIQRMQARFTAVDAISGIPLGRAYHGVSDGLTVELMAGVELFSARRVDEERIYVLRRKNAGYDVKRIDRNVADYYELLDDRKPQFDDDYVLKINGLGNKIEQKSTMFSELHRMCVAQHKDIFSRELHAYGYEKTTTEKVIDFALSLLPFYTCISESRNGNAAAAALACSVDILSLIPLIGVAGKLSVKFGQAFSRGAFVAMQTATSEVAARQTLKSILQHSAADFVRYGVVPASEVVGRAEMALAGRAVFNAFDPGFQLIGHLGWQSMRQAIKFGHLLETHLPALKEILPKLNSRLGPHLSNVDVIGDAVGFLPGIANAVKIKHLPEQYFKSKPVYVQIHPESGAPFGRKYTLAEDGRLHVVPMNMMRRLHHLREQGLGGRGAGAAAQTWADVPEENAVAAANVNTREMTAHLLRTVQGQPVGVGGVAQLARREGVAVSELEKYLDDQGILTEAGKAMLAQADAAEMGSSAAASLTHREHGEATLYEPVSSLHLRAWQHLTPAQRDQLGISNFCQMYDIDIDAFRIYLQQSQVPDLPAPVSSEDRLPSLAFVAEQNLSAPDFAPVNVLSEEVLTEWRRLRTLNDWRPIWWGLNRAQPGQAPEMVDAAEAPKEMAPSATNLWSGVITKDLLDQWRLFARQHPGRGNQVEFLRAANVNPRDWVNYVNAEGNIIRRMPTSDQRGRRLTTPPGAEVPVPVTTARQHSLPEGSEREYKRRRHSFATSSPAT